MTELRRQRTRTKPRKVIDEATTVRCATGDGAIREEVWEDADGAVVRYSLAFINFYLYARDNGRVLGYDNAHGASHRHFAGTVELTQEIPYDQVFAKFIAEVAALKVRKAL